MTKIAMMLTSL